MSSTRSIIAVPPFAANALTVIPPTPVAGVSYRDPIAGPASSPDGWPYAERVNSAEFNQIMYQSTSLLSIIDKKGILGWSSAIDYTEASICFGSDGALYSWIQASGPNNGGAKDPISSPTFWAASLRGQYISTRVFNTAGATVYTPTTGTRFIRVRGIGGGGAGGGAPATGAGQSSLGGAASSGSYAEAVFLTGFSGVTVTVGSGGVGNLGVAGGNGGATSFGALLTIPGGLGAISSPSLTSATLAGAAAPSAPTGGNIVSSRGTPGGYGLVLSAGNGIAGLGGPSVYGLANGNGGGGIFNSPSSAATVGQAGSAGLFLIDEYS